MRFFAGPFGTDGVDIEDRLGEFDLIASAAEQWGYDGLLLAEGRLPESDGWSAPFPLACYLTAGTQYLRIGVVCAPDTANPITYAEEAAVLDAFSNGRAFVVVRPSSEEERARLGAGAGDSLERFAEAVEIMVRSWAPTPFAFDGRFFRFPARDAANQFAQGIDRISVTPKPVQLRLPLWVAQSASRDMSSVARSWGASMMLFPGAMVMAGEQIGGSAAVRDLHVADTDDDAWNQALPFLRRRHNKPSADRRDFAGEAIVGGVDRCIDEIGLLTDKGISFLSCRFLWPGASARSVAQVMSLFAAGVVPEFRMEGFPREIRLRTWRGATT